MSRRSATRQWFTIMGTAAAAGRSRGDRAAWRGKKRWQAGSVMCRDRMRRVRSHFGDSAATGGRERDYLCQGTSARGAIRARDRNMVARFADRLDYRCEPELPCALGKNVPQVV